MSLRVAKNTLLAKVESTYGTDSVPVVGTNAIQIVNMKVTPIEQALVPRDLVRNFLGNSENLVAASWKMIEVTTELAGSGAAGTAPAWGVLMKGCAMGETINAGTSVVYAPISTGEQSLTLYPNIDGIFHKSLGVRGTFELSLDAQQRPTITWKFVGLFVAIADQALPVPVLTSWQKPLVVNNSNTSAFSLFSYAGILSKFSLSAGNQVAYRNLVGVEEVTQTDRKSTGSITIEHPTIAAKDYFTGMATATTGAFTVTHGTTAGNKVKIDTNSQLAKPQYGEENKVLMLQMEMINIPTSAGNDEFTITAL